MTDNGQGEDTMSDDIRIRPAEGTWVVRAGGAVLGESSNALELSAPGQPDRIYFPREDIAMAFLDRTDHVTRTPGMGEACISRSWPRAAPTCTPHGATRSPRAKLRGSRITSPSRSRNGVDVEEL